jgi:hypothetical protein
MAMADKSSISNITGITCLLTYAELILPRFMTHLTICPRKNGASKLPKTEIEEDMRSLRNNVLTERIGNRWLGQKFKMMLSGRC